MFPTRFLECRPSQSFLFVSRYEKIPQTPTAEIVRRPAADGGNRRHGATRRTPRRPPPPRRAAQPRRHRGGGAESPLKTVGGERRRQRGWWLVGSFDRRACRRRRRAARQRRARPPDTRPRAPQIPAPTPATPRTRTRTHTLAPAPAHTARARIHARTQCHARARARARARTHAHTHIVGLSLQTRARAHPRPRRPWARGTIDPPGPGPPRWPWARRWWAARSSESTGARGPPTGGSLSAARSLASAPAAPSRTSWPIPSRGRPRRCAARLTRCSTPPPTVTASAASGSSGSCPTVPRRRRRRTLPPVPPRSGPPTLLVGRLSRLGVTAGHGAGPAPGQVSTGRSGRSPTCFGTALHVKSRVISTTTAASSVTKRIFGDTVIARRVLVITEHVALRYHGSG
jgi:hypothetical protein